MEAEIPPEYPIEFVLDLRLGDGRMVHLRPILPRDRRALARAIALADPATLRARFLGWKPVIDDKMLHHLVEVDYRRRLALVAIDQAGNGVAIARYEGTVKSDTAEFAMVVMPDWRGVGLGSALFILLAQAAVRRGIRRFYASYLVDNEQVVRLLEASHLPCRTTVSDGVVEAELELCGPFQSFAQSSSMTPE